MRVLALLVVLVVLRLATDLLPAPHSLLKYRIGPCGFQRVPLSPSGPSVSRAFLQQAAQPAKGLRLGRPGAGLGKKAPRAKAVRPKRVNEQGQVSFVTADAVFVNRGTFDGLAAGQGLSFTRGGKPRGTCVVAAVSEHFARCSGTGLRAGDRFAVGRVAKPSPLGPTPLPTEGELLRRASTLDAFEWRLRDFEATSARGTGAGPRVEAFLSHTTFGSPGSATQPFGVQRLDVAVYDVDLWRGLRASVDLSALNFSARPAATRTVYQKSPVFLVRQLEVGFRRADVPFSGSLGRTWLRAATGLMVVDGAQAALRFSEGAEVGAYGGLLPDAALSAALTPSQWAVGAFGRVRFATGTGVGATLAQLSARAGWSQRDVSGGRAEVGLTASLWKGQVFDGHAGVEFGLGKTQAPGGLDAARLDLGWRPGETLHLTSAVRYRGLPLTGLTEVGAVSPGQRAIHSDLGVAWQAAHWLLVAAQAGLATDFDSGLLQVRVGPELSVPRLFGAPVGVSLSYLEEFGWLRGRHGSVQVNVTPMSQFRVLTRGSWFQQQASTGSLGLQGHEVGVSVAVEVTPWRSLKARVLVMGRVPLGTTTGPLGSVGAQLGGAF